MTLQRHESNIDAAYLQINLPPTERFFLTLKALYTIREHKLYKQRNANFTDYLLEKWSLQRRLGDRLCLAGGVIASLEKNFGRDELPANATLCIAVDHWSKKRKSSYAAVWRAALEHFDGRENAIACHFNEIYEEREQEPTTQEAPEPVIEILSSEDEESDQETSPFQDWLEEIESADPPVLPKRKRILSYSEVSSSNDNDSEMETTPSPVAMPPALKRMQLNLSTTIRNVFNTPQWLCDLIDTFTGGIDLDPCSNPTSKINAKTKYGYDKDNNFINALTLEDWEADTDWCYLNPPGLATTADEKSHGYHLHNPFWEKCQDEIAKGNVQRVIAIVPQRSYGKWAAFILQRALVCFLNVQVSFEKPDDTPYNGDVYARTICYLDSDDSYPYADHFVYTFGKYGYIPNVTMRIYKTPQPDRRLRYFSLCSGIGVAEMAIQSVYRNAICVGFSEIDESAISVYTKHFPNHRNFGDALNINVEELPDFDLLVGGIPCQPFSQQSINRTHFSDERSKLFDCYMSILEAKAPQHFLLENVPMSAEPRARITDALHANPVEINASNFTAQNRKRLYWSNWYIAPPLRKPSPHLKDIIELEPESQTVSSINFKDLPENPPNDVICSVNRNTATSVVKLRTDGKSNTITCNNCYQTVVAVNGIWRHYTIKERERLQGLPDEYTNCDGVTDAVKQKLLGNAMTLPVIEYIMKQL
ncbi:hypothetical protein HDU88_009035 [Geranomyces variabilis]|nr:hypothetical protein HDU88_009035 [Geranomyces variabilis]